MFLTEDDVLMW